MRSNFFVTIGAEQLETSNDLNILGVAINDKLGLRIMP